MEVTLEIGRGDHDGRGLTVTRGRFDRDVAGPSGPAVHGAELLRECTGLESTGAANAIGEEVQRVVRVGAPGAGGAAESASVCGDVRRGVHEVVRRGYADHRTVLGRCLAGGGHEGRVVRPVVGEALR